MKGEIIAYLPIVAPVIIWVVQHYFIKWKFLKDQLRLLAGYWAGIVIGGICGLFNSLYGNPQHTKFITVTIICAFWALLLGSEVVAIRRERNQTSQA